MEVTDKLIENYNRLKEGVIVKVGNADIEQMKLHFADYIESRRSLNRIKSLTDLIDILEVRGVLNYENVTAFTCISQLLENSSLRKEVKIYNKCYLGIMEGDKIKCKTCPASMSCSLHVSRVPLAAMQSGSSISSNNQNSVDELSKAIENVIQAIGKKWYLLAKELELREFQIEKIRAKYPSDHMMQAHLALLIWRANNPETASTEKLREALDARLCKKKGIGAHMMEPVIGVPIEA